MKSWTSKLTWIFIATSLTAPAYALKPADEAIIELYQRVEDLQHDVNSLRGQNEQLRHELDSVKKSQRESFNSVDDQIELLEGKIKAAPSDEDAATSDTSSNNDTEEKASDATADTTTETSDKNSENSSSRKVTDTVAYKRAYDLLKDDPDAAAADFADFLKDYPSSPLAANAHYWIGETWYSKEEFAKAKQSFLTVLKEYKGSNKEPDAALKLGYTFIAMKEWSFAKKTLQDVIKFFPGTRESDLAKKKLASIKDK